MELYLLPAPLPRRLIINPGSCFPAAATPDSGLRGSLCNQGTCIPVIPRGERAQGPPSPHMPAPPSSRSGRRRLFDPRCARPSSTGLPRAWCWRGPAAPIPPPLLCSALPCPGLPRRPPSARVSGERRSWPGAPRPRCRKGRASVTRGHPGLGLLSRCCRGRREEETPGVALSAGDTFPGL